MNARPTALVLRAPGTNCEQEMLRAFSLAGADARLAHIDELAEDPAPLRHAHLVGFPGGFSYGDDIASGRIFALHLRTALAPALRECVERGVPMIGACNGFQVMVQAGLLPGPASHDPLIDGHNHTLQSLALTDNQDARFVDRWVPIVYEPSSVCIWTKGLTSDALAPDARLLPAAHGEGRLVARSQSVLDRLETRGQIPVRYADNYNGSERAIAGVCDESGLVFGLMPHPERFLDWSLHPYAQRLDQRLRATEPPGLRIFRNAMQAIGALTHA